MSPDPATPEPGSEVDHLAAVVLGVPGVHGLHAGMFGEVATYLPGRRVTGLRARGTGWDVHVVLAWGASVGTTSDAVRAALRPGVTGPIDVTVEDVAEPGDDLPGAPTGTTTGTGTTGTVGS